MMPSVKLINEHTKSKDLYSIYITMQIVAKTNSYNDTFMLNITEVFLNIYHSVQ